MICVPLFMILTGYLMNKKAYSLKYYLNLSKVVFVYLCSCLACLLYKRIFLNQSLNFYDVLKGIFDFTLSPYSWYVNMYIGLYLIIPFLNKLYDNLRENTDKKIFVFTLVFLVSMPSLFSVFNLNVLNWWQGIFPLMYYFIGSYLHDNEIRLSNSVLILMILLSVTAFGGLNFYLSYGKKFVWSSCNDWGGFENLLDSVLIFVFCLKLNLKRLPVFLKKVIILFSKISLGIYLYSWIFDQYFYSKFGNVADLYKRPKYYFCIVPIVFVCSSIFAWLTNVCYEKLKLKLVRV